MHTWRCPHCATPQEESSRCWVCHRSSTSCGTCRHFRGSVAARVGFCGLDRRRAPLRGDEVRACWEDGAVPLAPDPPIPGLLDLLTVAALGEAAEDAPPARRRAIEDAEAGDLRAPAIPERAPRPVPRLRSLNPNRGWIEVEV